MRKYVAYSVLLLLFIAGCETDRIIFNGPYHVRFTQATGFSKESVTDTVKIEVHNVGPAPAEDITIGYTIGGDAREDVDYVILENRKKVTIPAGEYFGYIKILLINNANNILRSQNIILTLQSTTVDKLEVGQGTSQIGNTYTFTIFDDCILGGIYTGRRSANSTAYEDLSVTGVTGSDCNEYVLSNWNIDIFSSSTVMDLSFKDNGDNTLTIPEQEETELDADLATIFGTGVVDPTTGEILLKITLKDFDNSPEVSFTLKRQ